MKTYRSLIAASLMLAALVPLQTHAADKTWTGVPSDGWDFTTANWTTLLWVDGDNAIFPGGTPLVVNLSNTVAPATMTFSAANYVIYSPTNGTNLTLNGAASITNNATGTSIATTIEGSGTLDYSGTGDLTLRGNTTGFHLGGGIAGSGNTYTGDTFIRSGTLVLSVTNRATSGPNFDNLDNHGTEWAVAGVGAVDPGATLKIGNFFDGSLGSTNRAGYYKVPRGQTKEIAHIIMSGGTLDLNGDDNNQRYPAVLGTGYIVNSSPYIRAVLKVDTKDNVYGLTLTNSCIIGDPNPVVLSPLGGTGGGDAFGKIAHEIDMDVGNSAPTTWYFTGANTFLGSWRIANGGCVVRFTQNGGMGSANAFITPNTIRINGSSPANRLDLWGTSQTTGGFAGNATSSGPNGLVCNDNPGTLSILTIGVANLGLAALAPYTTNVGTLANVTNINVVPGAGSTWNGAVLDNTGTGGTLGVTKIGTNIAQFIGKWSISGPLVVSNGVLNIVPGAGGNPWVPVLNGPVRLYNSGNPALGLVTSAGNSVIPVPALYLNGVPQTNGLYGSIGNTAGAAQVTAISNGGTPNGDVLQVANFQPPMTVTNNGTSLDISWPYVTYKLQSQTNVLSVGLTSTWYDYPGGGSSPVNVPIDQSQPTVFFRLAPAP